MDLAYGIIHKSRDISNIVMTVVITSKRLLWLCYIALSVKLFYYY